MIKEITFVVSFLGIYKVCYRVLQSVLQCVIRGDFMDINLINQYLEQGLSVKEVREKLGLGEKNYLANIKKLGYKYDKKLKQYVTQEVLQEVLQANNNICNTSSTTNSSTEIQEQSMNFIYENIDTLHEMIMYYKRNKQSNTNSKGIIIDLIDDKNIDNGKPVSVRVNKHIWKDWQEFTKDTRYSSKELVSMALKEFMEKYNNN